MGNGTQSLVWTFSNLTLEQSFVIIIKLLHIVAGGGDKERSDGKIALNDTVPEKREVF